MEGTQTFVEHKDRCHQKELSLRHLKITKLYGHEQLTFSQISLFQTYRHFCPLLEAKIQKILGTINDMANADDVGNRNVMKSNQFSGDISFLFYMQCFPQQTYKPITVQLLLLLGLGRYATPDSQSENLTQPPIVGCFYHYSKSTLQIYQGWYQTFACQISSTSDKNSTKQL